MTYKTSKRRKQRVKQVFVKIRRRRWIEAIREEAYQDWLKRYKEGKVLNESS